MSAAARGGARKDHGAAPTVLVTGATGRVGRCVVAELLAAGARVRALTRRPETAVLPGAAEVLRGDLEDPDSLSGALEGVGRLYLFPVPGTAREVTALAERSGVERVVVLSSALAEQDDGPEGYGPVERAVRESGMEWSLVRPGEFAANWLDYAPEIRTRREVRRPYARAVGRPVHEADVAAVAAACLLDPGRAGGIHTFAGPEELTAAEQVRAIGAAIGEEVRFTELTPEQTRAEWYDPEQGVDHAVIDWLLELYASSVEGGPVLPGTGDFERITGRAPRTFAQWARDHAADFR